MTLRLSEIAKKSTKFRLASLGIAGRGDYGRLAEDIGESLKKLEYEKRSIPLPISLFVAFNMCERYETSNAIKEAKTLRREVYQTLPPNHTRDMLLAFSYHIELKSYDRLDNVKMCLKLGDELLADSAKFSTDWSKSNYKHLPYFVRHSQTRLTKLLRDTNLLSTKEINERCVKVLAQYRNESFANILKIQFYSTNRLSAEQRKSLKAKLEKIF